MTQDHTTTNAVCEEAARLLDIGARAIEKAWQKHGKDEACTLALHHRTIAARLRLIAARPETS